MVIAQPEIVQPKPLIQHMIDLVEQMPFPVPPLQNVNFLHHEILEDFLKNDDELAEQNLLEQQQNNQVGHFGDNLQVGLVRIVKRPPPMIVSQTFGNRPILFP